MRGWIAMLIPIAVVLYFGTHPEQFQKVVDWVTEMAR
jgi:hypothetical protein